MTPVNPAPNSPAKGPSPTGLAVSSKIQPCHPDRLAIVSVRQSTIQQVTENRESTNRQYSRVNRAIELDWPAMPPPSVAQNGFPDRLSVWTTSA